MRIRCDACDEKAHDLAEQGYALATYIVEHPGAARGAGEQRHAQWLWLQTAAQKFLNELVK